MWKNAITIIMILGLMGVAYGVPTIIVTSPSNTTIFNSSFALSVSTNETATNWSYSLDGASNVSFVPNITVSTIRGQHTIDVFVNDSSNIFNTTQVKFITSYVEVRFVDERASADIANLSGKIKFSNGTTAVNFNTDDTGRFNFTGFGLDDYFVQGGNTSPLSGYPFIREFPFTFDDVSENVTMRLAARDDCETVFLQFIDFDFGNAIDSPLVTFVKANNTLHQVTGDQGGFASDCLIIGDTYTFKATKQFFLDLSVSKSIFTNTLELNMRRVSIESLDTSIVSVQTFPESKIVMPNGTLALGMYVFDPGSGITEIGVVIGSDELVLVDDSIPITTNYKQIICNITVSDTRGGLLTCPGFDLSTWDEADIKVDYFYVRNGTKFHKVVVFRKDVVSRIPLGPFPITIFNQDLTPINPSTGGEINPWRPKPPGPVLKSVFYQLGFGDLAINTAGIMISGVFGVTVGSMLGATAGFFVISIFIILLIFVEFLSWKTLAIVVIGFVVWGSKR